MGNENLKPNNTTPTTRHTAIPPGQGNPRPLPDAAKGTGGPKS
jgi:hypothetical protein